MASTWIIAYVFISSVVTEFADDPTVKIITTDPVVDPVSGYIIQEKDKDVQLTCVVENKPADVNVLWMVQKRTNSTPIQISTGNRSLDALKWAIDKPSMTSWRLRIKNVQVTDEGLYICKVQVVIQTYVSDQRELRVVQVPQISNLNTSSDMIKNADDPARLECYATGRPTPLIKWTRMDGELLPNGGTEFQGSVLTIDRVQSDHDGVYKCTAENSAGEDTREIRLTVSFRPEVVANVSNVSQAVGYQMKLVCNIKSYPLPTPEHIVWSREGLPVTNNSRIQVQNIPEASNRMTTILDIREVIKSDFGTYTCSGENSKGTQYSSIVFTEFADDPTVKIITTDPVVDPVSGYIIQDLGKDVQLTCVLENKPADANVLWMVQKRTNSTPIQISTGNRSLDALKWAIDKPSMTSWRLHIKNVQVTDEGLYICKVQVVAQSYVSDQRELRVVQVPQISNLNTSSDMIKNADDPARLECYATGRPTPLIKWTRMDGELLPNGGTEFQGSVLTIDRVQSDHDGVYKCTAENSAGEDTREIRLTVSFRPEVVANVSNVSQAVGYQMKLVCNIKSYPPPSPEQIAWSREGLPVTSNSRIQVRNIPEASNRMTTILNIREVIKSDFGTYTCSGENSKGTQYSSIVFTESNIPTGPTAHAAILSFNIAAILMLVTVCLLQML